MNRTRLLRIAVLIVAPAAIGCDGDSSLLLPARESAALELDGFTLVARLVHISDTHVVDEESPARFPGAQVITRSAWRPYEAYSTQLLDGIIRTANRVHASGRTIDFLMLTGDTCDNVQSNELEWLLGLFDGAVINPLTGPDERPDDERPERLLDAHAPFHAQGLYRTGVHGDAASIPWYVVFGNHDVFSIGVFPIFESSDGQRTAPLPLDFRPGLFLPVVLDPLASSAHGNVTPAEPGPPGLFETPRLVEPNAARAYFSKAEYVAAMFTTVTEPPGHGFADPGGSPSWYSVSPVPGLRLIGLDSTDRDAMFPGGLYMEGALTRGQFEFLRGELETTLARGELVIVTSHHPSTSLLTVSDSAITGDDFRALLNEYPNVVLHLAGHVHRNRVTDQGGYLEIETCSTLDPPQEGRLIEIWRHPDGTVAIAYEMFSHIDDTLPPLGDDPLRRLRAVARAIALGDKDVAERQRQFDADGADPHGNPLDRHGFLFLER